MSALRYTLLTDGSSDRCLVWIINWLLSQTPVVASRGFVPQVAGRDGGLGKSLQSATQQFPCDLLFVHRDAERESREQRLNEISNAIQNLPTPPHVPIIPVRMTEAWLLLDESAIRTAADNPNGQVTLALPRISDLESLPDPKNTLFGLLIAASEKSGRRRDQFKRDLPDRRQRVAELTRDFSPLRRLPAFTALESDLQNVLTNLHRRP